MSDDGTDAPQQLSGDSEPTRHLVPAGGATPQPVSQWTENTVDMPPEALAKLSQKAPPQRATTRPPRFTRVVDEERRPAFWTYIVTGIVVVGVLLGLTYAIVGPPSHQLSGAGDISGCSSGSPCQVANSYLADYTGAKYDKMYGLISAASITKFSDPAILKGSANFQVNSVSYTDAKDYVLSRTKGILDRVQVAGMSATLGKIHQVNSTHVTFPARVIMKTSNLGDVIADVTLSMTLEHGSWRVDWSPGVILPQLDDPADPTYTRLVRLTTQIGKRGSIFSSDGQIIAQDSVVDIVGVVPSKITDATAVTMALVTHLDVTSAEVLAAYQGKDPTQFWPIRTISPALYTQVSASLQAPGIQIQAGTGRIYPFGTVMAPITGYIGQVGPSDISSDASHYYQSGDSVGRAGVEKWGEQWLRPAKGGSLVIRSRNADGSDGQIVSTIASRSPQDGASITTTVDVATQQASMATLANQGGHSGGTAAVAPSTGNVISLATYPTYDPNDFSLGFTANEQARFNALSSPYLNRATMAADPTGSIFKIVTLAAALENGISADQVFVCKGSYLVPGESQPRADDNPAGHGSLTAPAALGPSCDVVFWQVAVALNQKGPNLLSDAAKKFGFGVPTGIIGLPADEDNPGLVPDPQWLKANKNAGWSPTDAANLGIGQGFFQASPLQVALLAAGIANNGVRQTPLLVTKIVDATGTTVKTFAPKTAGQDPLSAANMQIVQVAMLGPTYGSNGTAPWDFATYPVIVAGKTGTAESGQDLPHAWFVCYAPAQKISGPPVAPQIAVGVLVEYSGGGHLIAAPISKTIMSAYLHLSQ